MIGLDEVIDDDFLPDDLCKLRVDVLKVLIDLLRVDPLHQHRMLGRLLDPVVLEEDGVGDTFPEEGSLVLDLLPHCLCADARHQDEVTRDILIEVSLVVVLLEVAQSHQLLHQVLVV